MIRFLLFILGTIAGLVTAIFVLPIPGKTFFNKMSRLPTGVKTLIDDGIELGVAFWRLLIGVSDDIGFRLRQSLESAKAKTEEVSRRLEANKRQDIRLRQVLANDEDDISEDVAEKLSAQ